MKIFIKETDYAKSSLYLSFCCNSQERQFLKGILGRKSPCIMIRGKVTTLSNISRGAFVWKKSTAKSHYLFLQKALSQMLDWVLNAPLMMTVASYWGSIPNKRDKV